MTEWKGDAVQEILGGIRTTLKSAKSGSLHKQRAVETFNGKGGKGHRKTWQKVNK